MNKFGLEKGWVEKSHYQESIKDEILIEWYVGADSNVCAHIYKAQSYKELDITETERALNTGQTIESATFVKDIVTPPFLGPLTKPWCESSVTYIIFISLSPPPHTHAHHHTRSQYTHTHTLKNFDSSIYLSRSPQKEDTFTASIAY